MNRNRRLWAALVALPLLAAAGCAKHAPGENGAQEAESQPFGRLTMEELDARMADAKAGKLTLAIYDNNHKDRFDKGHIPGAKWVKPDALTAADLPADKEATLVFYCANEH